VEIERSSIYNIDPFYAVPHLDLTYGGYSIHLNIWKAKVANKNRSKFYQFKPIGKLLVD
jgi:hypothetical protein